MIEYENLRKVNEPFFKDLNYSFNELLKSGLYILGNNFNIFEKEFASYCGSSLWESL